VVDADAASHRWREHRALVDAPSSTNSRSCTARPALRFAHIWGYPAHHRQQWHLFSEVAEGAHSSNCAASAISPVFLQNSPASWSAENEPAASPADGAKLVTRRHRRRAEITW